MFKTTRAILKKFFKWNQEFLDIDYSPGKACTEIFLSDESTKLRYEYEIYLSSLFSWVKPTWMSREKTEDWDW